MKSKEGRRMGGVDGLGEKAFPGDGPGCGLVVAVMIFGKACGHDDW